MFGKTKKVMKSTLPKDVRVEEGKTLTFGQLKQAIKLNKATTATLGLSYRHRFGFDSCMSIRHLALVNGKLYLFSKSQLPMNPKYAKSLGQSKLLRIKHSPSIEDILNLKVPSKTEVLLAIPKFNSINGSVTTARFVSAGPMCWINATTNTDDEDYEVRHEVGVVSIEAIVDDEKNTKDDD